jgi:hypothetical protein
LDTQLQAVPTISTTDQGCRPVNGDPQDRVVPIRIRLTGIAANRFRRGDKVRDGLPRPIASRQQALGDDTNGSPRFPAKIGKPFSDLRAATSDEVAEPAQRIIGRLPAQLECGDNSVEIGGAAGFKDTNCASYERPKPRPTSIQDAWFELISGDRNVGGLVEERRVKGPRKSRNRRLQTLADL